MGIIFFEFDPSAFKSFLESKGFQPTVQHNELVYIRRHHKSPNVIVKIYTTISCNSSAVRSSGSDAIRIVAVFDNGVKSFGIGKFPKIYRRLLGI